MSTAVISVSVPRRLKEELERLGIDYAEEIRRFLEARVREERARRVRERLRRLHERLGYRDEDLAPTLIREDRDGR